MKFSQMNLLSYVATIINNVINRCRLFKLYFLQTLVFSDHILKEKNQKILFIEITKTLENKIKECPKHYKEFEKTFVNLLDSYAPRKTKVLRGNQKLRKAIMKWSKIKNRANRTKFKMILLTIRNNEISQSSLVEIQNFIISKTQRYQKIQNLLRMKVNPTFPTSMLMVALRQFLTIQKKLSKRKSYQ